LTFITTIRTN